MYNAQHLKSYFDNPHKKVAVAYSGGKDSTVLLDLCKPYRDRFTLVWINTGFAFPHIEEHVLNVAKDYNFIEVGHDLMQTWDTYGLPVKVAPLEHLPQLKGAGAKKPFMQPWIACCSRRMESATAALLKAGFTDLLTGQRAADGFKCLSPIQNDKGLNIHAAIWNWSDEMIKHHITHNQLKLPAFSSDTDSSMECWICPYMPDEGRMAFIKRRHPEYAAKVQEVAQPLLSALRAAIEENERLFQ